MDWRRWLKRAALAGLVLGGVSFVTLIGAWLWLRSDTGNRWIVTKASNAASGGGVSLELESFDTDLWSKASVTGLSLRTESGLTLLADTLSVEIDRNALFRRELRLKQVDATGLFVDMTASTEAGEGFGGLGAALLIDRINLTDSAVVYRNVDGDPVAQVAHASGTATLEAAGPDLWIRQVDLQGELTLQGPAATSVQGDLRIDREGVHFVDTTVRLAGSDLGITGLAGPTLDLQIDARKLAGHDLDALLGDVGLQGEVAGEVAVTGISTTPSWTADLTGAGGAIKGSGTVDLTTDTLGFTVDLQLDGVHAEQLVDTIGDEVTLTGHATIDGRGTAWPEELELDVHWEGEAHEVYGQHIDALSGDFAVRQGQLQIQNTALDGILGDLNIEGDMDVVDGPLSLHITGGVHPQRLRELGIGSVNRTGWIDAMLTGNPLEDTPLHIAGRIRYAPFVYGADVEFDALVAQFDLDMLGADFDGTASVEASGGTTYGVELATVSIAELSFVVDANGTKAQGDLDASELVMPDTFFAANATGAWTFSDQQTTASLGLGPLNLMEFPGTSGHIDVDMRGANTHFEVDLLDSGRTLLSTSGSYGANSTLDLDTLRFSPTPRAEWVTSGTSTMRLTDGGVADADLSLTSNLGAISLLGTVGTSGPLEGSVEVRGLAVDTIAELLPNIMPPAAGVLDISLDLGGDAKDPKLDCTFSTDRLWLEGQTRWLDLSGELHGADGAMEIEMDVGVAGEPLAHIDGHVPTRLDLADPWINPAGAVDLSIALIPGGMHRLERAFPAAGILPEGAMGGVVEITGRLADPDFRAAGIAELSVQGWDEPGRAEWDWSRSGGAFLGWFDIREGTVLRASAHGLGQTDLREVFEPWATTGDMPEDVDWPTLATNLVLEGQFLNFPAASLASAVGVDVSLNGDIAGTFAVRGDPITPHPQLDLRWDRGSVGTQEVTDGHLVLTPERDGYTIFAKAVFGDAGDVFIKGAVPLAIDLRTEPETWSTQEMSLVLGGNGIPLKVLTAFDPTLQRLTGVMTLKGGIRGTVFDPLPTLAIGIEEGSMRVPSMGLRLEHLGMQIRATHREILVTSFDVDTLPNRRRRLGSELQDLADEVGSHIRASGGATLQDGAVQEVAAQAELTGGAWVINTQQAVLRTDGEITIGGTWPELQVGGKLSLRDGHVSVDAAAFLDRAPLQPNPQLHIMRSQGTVAAREASEPWYQDVSAHVKLDLKRNLDLNVSMPFVDDLGALGAAVSRADLAARLGGQTVLIMHKTEPRMKGEVNLVDGSLRLLQSRFTVEEGTITFTGANLTDPLLNLNAEMTIPGVTINAAVTGTPSAPLIDLSSEELADQTDILMVLLTGQLPDDLGGGTTTESLAGLLLGSILGGQGLGNISYDPDGSIRAVVPISQTVYGKTTVSPSARASEENGVSAELEWSLAPRVVLDAGVGNVFSWTDLYWELRF
jgi:autotransporter translocation and assembly factor TamB